eukprot:CAMPEP_0172778228 /NCGR_PEP_ID=MMETSP1074-20121228/201802_1 /TAXON_ID=2916 /ORGANISM="Ceratium fusus, Strain PA161109" /LENGTH=556 /DNA_ID=CAMNT_0013615159 /DNA_START=101 /DNA_END=1768 /DNA_ORIENTATION=+
MNKHGSRGDNLGRGRVRSEDTKGVKDLAYKLAGDFRDSKLEGATIIVDRLERLKDLAVDGQVEQMRQLKDVMKNWRGIFISVPYKRNEFATGEQMRQLKDVMKNWRGIFISVPYKRNEFATGDIAFCSCWYAPKVEVKLKDLFEEFVEIEEAFAQIKPDKFQDLGRRMDRAMERITPTVYGMHDLPDEVNDVADRADEREETLKDTDTKAMKKLLESQGMTISLSSLEDCKRGLLDLVEPTYRNLEKVRTFVLEAHDKFKQAFEVPCPCSCMTRYVYDQPSRCLTELLENADRALDTKAMKKKLGIQGMTRSLSSLEDCKQGLLDLIEPTQRNLEKVQTFVSEAHDKFKQAFEVPCPCCCMTRYVYDQPSRCLMELLENADRAVDVDLQPFFELLSGLKDHYWDLDMNRIGKPTKRFAALATERVDRLDKIVAGVRPSGSYCLMQDCKRGLLDLVEPTYRNLEKVRTFVLEAHDKFKQAFEVPCPCSCMTRYVYDQPSRCLTELLENADRALDVDLQPFFELLRGLKDDYSDLDLNRVSKPTNRFAALATERVDRL